MGYISSMFDKEAGNISRQLVIAMVKKVSNQGDARIFVLISCFKISSS